MGQSGIICILINEFVVTNQQNAMSRKIRENEILKIKKHNILMEIVKDKLGKPPKIKTKRGIKL